MKMVFEKFESSLPIQKNAINVIRIEDRSLFARCAQSLASGFSENCLEPAFFFDNENHELKPDKILFFLGDPISIDLNDKRILSQAIKVLASRAISESNIIQRLETLNYQIEDLFEELFIQMSADYSFVSELDISKELKLFGFSIEENNCLDIPTKLNHLLRIMADLFPNKIVCFVNLRTYLSDKQYNEFCQLAVALQIRILSYEQGSSARFENLDNGLFIDANYLEN